MCGIAGQVKSGGADGNLVRHMCDVLAHRGPDEEGHWQEGAVALSMRRLAIIDVGHGQQPIFNEDGSVAVVLNGEIYNFRDLRKGLVARGHRFSTMSDTEVVAHLYEEQGADCVQELRGMFAFAIWDRKRGSLILARDRVGKKPLYYTLTPDGILFASELKALMQDGALPRRVDLEALHHYLTYQYVPAPWSILRGREEVAPRHYSDLQRRGGEVTAVLAALLPFENPTLRSRPDRACSRSDRRSHQDPARVGETGGGVFVGRDRFLTCRGGDG